MTKLKISKFYKTQQLKFNKTKKNVTQLKKSISDKSYSNEFLRKKSSKLKIVRRNLNLKLLQNSKTWIVTTIKSLNWDKVLVKFKKKTQTVTKFNNLNCDKAQQLKLWQTSKTQILIKRTISDKSLLLAICDLAMFIIKSCVHFFF